MFTIGGLLFGLLWFYDDYRIYTTFILKQFLTTRSHVELLNFCSLLHISLITLCQSKISLSERPAYNHHSYQYICLSSIHLYCYANVIPLANRSGPLFGGVRSPLFMSPSNFYMSTNTGYWCNSILAIILYCCCYDCCSYHTASHPD